MNGDFIYTDKCSQAISDKIKKELNLDVVQRIEATKWNINDTMSIITNPSLKLAVVNVIDELSVMECALLYFMCKPILITAISIKSYPKIEQTIASYIDQNSNLTDSNSNFISWYRQVGI
jgi:hypothetical protein